MTTANIILSAIQSDPEKVIRKALEFNPEIKEGVDAARKVKPEAIIPLAALATRRALSTYGRTPGDANEFAVMLESE